MTATVAHHPHKCVLVPCSSACAGETGTLREIRIYISMPERFPLLYLADMGKGPTARYSRRKRRQPVEKNGSLLTMWDKVCQRAHLPRARLSDADSSEALDTESF